MAVGRAVIVTCSHESELRLAQIVLQTCSALPNCAEEFFPAAPNCATLQHVPPAEAAAVSSPDIHRQVDLTGLGVAAHPARAELSSSRSAQQLMPPKPVRNVYGVSQLSML